MAKVQIKNCFSKKKTPNEQKIRPKHPLRRTKTGIKADESTFLTFYNLDICQKNAEKFCRNGKKSYFCKPKNRNDRKKISSLSYGVTVAHLTLDQLV